MNYVIIFSTGRFDFLTVITMLPFGPSLLFLVASASSFSTAWHYQNETLFEITTSIPENYNLSSIESFVPRSIPSSNMETYMSTVKPSLYI